MVDDFTTAHLEILRICELLKWIQNHFSIVRQRFLVRHKQIRNRSLSKL